MFGIASSLTATTRNVPAFYRRALGRPMPGSGTWPRNGARTVVLRAAEAFLKLIWAGNHPEFHEANKAHAPVEPASEIRSAS